MVSRAKKLAQESTPGIHRTEGDNCLPQGALLTLTFPQCHLCTHV